MTLLIILLVGGYILGVTLSEYALGWMHQRFPNNDFWSDGDVLPVVGGIFWPLLWVCAAIAGLAVLVAKPFPYVYKLGKSGRVPWDR